MEMIRPKWTLEQLQEYVIESHGDITERVNDLEKNYRYLMNRIYGVELEELSSEKEK